MTDTDSRNGSRSLLLRIKSAYWVALLAIAAMAAVSFATLSSMMSDQGRDTGIMMFANKQAEIVRGLLDGGCCGDAIEHPRVSAQLVYDETAAVRASAARQKN